MNMTLDKSSDPATVGVGRPEIVNSIFRFGGGSPFDVMCHLRSISRNDHRNGFSLIELMVVTAIIATLAALSLPLLVDVKNSAKRATCLNNLRQIDLGIHMYCDDANDASPMTKSPYIAYKELMKNYVGLNGSSSSNDTIFACPSDTFYYYGVRIKTNGQGFFSMYQLHSHHSESRFDYSSYFYNASFPNIPTNNTTSDPLPGVGNRKLSSIKEPSKTILVAEAPAFYPYSWHDPKKPSPNGLATFNNAKDTLGFVDGHVSYTKMYWNSGATKKVMGYSFPQWSASYNPPDGYNYKWSED